MKRLLLVATLAVAGFTGTVSAKGSIIKDVKSSKAVGAKCYNYVYDKYGNIIGKIEVACPDIIVT
jgi:hypothetical protein